VDFRATNLDPLEQLIWGITGEKPREQSHVSSSNSLAASQQADVKELLPPKHKQVIEIRLPGSLDEFSDKERDRILAGLNALLEVGEVRVTRAMAGSIRLHLELKPEDADKIYFSGDSKLAVESVLEEDDSRLDARTDRRADSRADLWAGRRAKRRADLRVDLRADCRLKSRWFSRDQALCVATNSLAEWVYAIQLDQIS
jgi:hypothetical protein